MPEEFFAAIGETAFDALVAVGIDAASFSAIATAVELVSAVYVLREQQRRAEGRARDAYNASLRDRYLMLRGAVEQRQIVLGRQRVSGPVGFIQSWGADRRNLVFTVVLAAHEVDAIETVYFDDEPVVLDGGGNVVGIRRTERFSIAAPAATVTLASTPKPGTITASAQYGSATVTLGVGAVSGTSVSVSGARAGETGLLVLSYQPDPCPFVPDETVSRAETFIPAAATASLTLTDSPSGAVHASQTQGAGRDAAATEPAVAIAGRTATLSGCLPGVPCTLSYQTRGAPSRARVRMHLGGAGQTADAGMLAALPGVWTSAHVGAGLAYLAVELDYDADAFPGGIPNVSAVVRGLKCLDPRTGLSAWTQNPALLLRAYALHPLGGRLQAGQVDDASIAAAASACDAGAVYTLRYSAFGALTTLRYTLPTYIAGCAVKAGVRPADTLTDLAQAMGGRWCIVDGALRVKAGVYAGPVVALDETWLHEGGAVQIQPRRNRADVVNAITGTFADAAAGYRVGPFPKVVAPAYVAEDGRELPSDVPMAAVTWTGQAQHIAACQLRHARQGVTVRLTCNLRAYPLEPFDVVSVSLARFGWALKTFEVLDTSWTLEGGIELSLKEVDPSIWAMDAEFSATDPAPDTRLPSPWGLPLVAGLSASSGAADFLKQADGSLVSRILVSWTALTDLRVTRNGSIEIRWGLATDSESTWHSLLCAGSAVSVHLSPVHTGASYLVKARARSADTAGDWCAHVLCAVSATAPSGIVVGVDNIPPGAITDIVAPTLASATGAWVRGAVDALTARRCVLLQASWTNTAAVAVPCEIAVDFGGARSAGAGTVHLRYEQAWASIGDGDYANADGLLNSTDVSTAYGRYVKTTAALVPAGATLYVAAVAIIGTDNNTTTAVQASELTVKIIAIKR